ncbi:MAG: pyridoxal phosphate-dependent aminotransferase [Peptoniphilus sp.]|nr:pyridoxal phosphate-dependent aminotransferase [Peptoniphilus sp.]MDD7363458.1 pyridoxal phosphate-dependent aminotransferase [Bacillota bacterium]MDY6044838.1 pyridoxal phosphate-dependent aminotransferase [Peptoniphilus sp.]
MANKKMTSLGKQKSVIRELAGFGAERAKVVGPENVLNFSIGNPSVPAPKEVQEAIIDITKNETPQEVHSYSAGNGFESTRKAIADNLNERYGTDYTADNLYMTCGAAASLNISLAALIEEPTDEVVVVAPFFPEYNVFIESQGGKMVLVEPRDDMELHADDVEKVLTENTRAVLINTPNNPSGVIYSKESIEALADLLEKKSKEIGHPIYILSDEPYRELVLVDDAEVAWVPNIYDNTVVCYSWSKSLSLPGERIGYILVPDKVEDKDLMPAVAGAGRSLGYVCAPTLMQKVIERCVGVEPDVEVYKKNRDLLFDALTEMGYVVAKPAGAFYLFIKSPDGDSETFSDRAKEYDMLVVPGTGFGSKAFMRLSYCVDTETCEKAIPIFKEMMEKYYS